VPSCILLPLRGPALGREAGIEEPSPQRPATAVHPAGAASPESRRHAGASAL